jgi:hypothetical protein
MDDGRGLISCGQGGNWYAPGAVTVEAGSVAAQIGGEKIDMVDPVAGLGASLEEAFRSLHDRFGLAWDEKSAQADPVAEISFFEGAASLHLYGPSYRSSGFFAALSPRCNYDEAAVKFWAPIFQTFTSLGMARRRGPVRLSKRKCVAS